MVVLTAASGGLVPGSTCAETRGCPLRLRSAISPSHPAPASAIPHGPSFRDVQLAPDVHRSMPDSIALFLYRPVEEVVASGMRVFRYRGSTVWWCDRLHAMRVLRPLLAALLASRRSLGERLVPAAALFSNSELAGMGASACWPSPGSQPWSAAPPWPAQG